jgi:hypothetical protein
MGIPIIGDLINGVKDLISEVVVDKDKRDQVNLELAQLQDQAQARLDAQLLAQVEVNKIEASSGSLFVAGWRPAIGWVGATALAYSYVVSPFLAIWMTVPKTDFDGLIYIITAMLGIGGMRTFEKVKGVSTNDYRDVPARVQPKEVVSTEPAKTDEVPRQSKPPYRHFKI